MTDQPKKPRKPRDPWKGITITRSYGHDPERALDCIELILQHAAERAIREGKARSDSTEAAA